MNPMGYVVALKDNNGNQVAHIDNKIARLDWEWDRIGGCGACRMLVKEDFDAALAGSFTEDYEIDIFLPTVNGTAEQWYGGYIDKVTPFESGEDSFINVFCLGYVNQLKRAVVRDQSYTGREIGGVVKEMAEVYATGITSITSAAANYEDTGFIADSLYFDENLYDAIRKLASIAGKREWGVRADKSLFFLRRNDRIERYYHIPEDIENFTPSKDYNPMITKIYLEGSDNYKQTFVVTNKITTREKIVQNSAITTQSVGQQFGRMYLKENGIVRRSYKGALVERNTRLESILPIGKAAINIKIGIKSLYDVATNLYDSHLKYDGGVEAFQIEKIHYTLTDAGVTATLTFGVVPPNIVDEMQDLKYLIEAERIKS